MYLLENAKLLGMNEIRAAALKGAKFDIDREVEGVRALDRYTFQLRLGEPSPRFHLYLADNSFLGAVAREVVGDVRRQAAPRSIRSAPARSGWSTGAARRAWCSSAIPATATTSTTPQPAAGDAVGEAMAAQLRGRKLPLVDRVEVYIVEENQPRWLAFLNTEHDLVDELPYDFANLVIPNDQLAPNLQRRSIQMDRAPRANVDMALFNMEHPVVGGYTPEKVALRRAIGLAYDGRRRDPRWCARARRFRRSRRSRRSPAATTRRSGAR